MCLNARNKSSDLVLPFSTFKEQREGLTEALVPNYNITSPYFLKYSEICSKLNRKGPNMFFFYIGRVSALYKIAKEKKLNPLKSCYMV
jgi:hypothetical protein